MAAVSLLRLGVGPRGTPSFESFVLGLVAVDSVEIFSIAGANIVITSVEPFSIEGNVSVDSVEPFNLGTNLRVDSVEPFTIEGADTGYFGPSPASPQLGYWDR